MRAAILVLALAGLVPSAAVADDAPLASACSGKCDKDAAACVDACEAKYGSDAAKRVGCKVECAKKREACDAQCAP